MGLRHLICALLLAGCIQAPKQFKVTADDIAIIPQPKLIDYSEDQFVFDEKTIIHASADLKNEVALLQAGVKDLLGFTMDIRHNPSETILGYAVTLKVDSTLSAESDEWYMLGIQKHFIIISAKTPKGLMHGIQTFLQIIPKHDGSVSLPGLLIRDEPKFPHRGLLLDCCRHFWSVDVVKKYIDLLAYYKMNVLHWHLTEDQGWRLEINKYPKLTEIGAWRMDEDGSRYGGFYTQEDIKDIVKYASFRHITIIPEIELPGHSLAALAAYPHLACTDGPFEVTPEWGVFKDVYCAGNDSTFMFLEDVLTEVIDLFPSQYIHIGGDESPKYRWENCDKCQNRINDEGLHDEHELQSYFIRRIQTFLNENNRKLIGWDEILEGGLAKGATVQSWRGMQGGIDAATSGNYAIMSPTSHCYLDYGLESIDLEEIYKFDPIPDSLDPSVAHRIIGGECNMWTEHVPTEDNLDSKVFPRMVGLAEVLWTYDENRSFTEFTSRLEKHYPRLEDFGVNYGFEKIPVRFETEIVEGGIRVSVQKATPELIAKVKYTGGMSTEWNSDSTFSVSQKLKFTANLNGRDYPKDFPLNVSVHKGIGIEPNINAEFSPYYKAGGPSGLTDGIKATIDFRDGRWQGYQIDKPLEIVIDLGESQFVQAFISSFYQYNNAWIFAPTKVEYFASTDGITYNLIGSDEPRIKMQEKGKFIESFVVDLKEPVDARFVKLVANSIGRCPSWHDAAGSTSWLFVDEFVIN